MTSKLPAEFAMWHVSVAKQVLNYLWEPFEEGQSEGPVRPSGLSVEIHAGSHYAHPLMEILRVLGVKTTVPCEGLGIGQQLALYTSGACAPPEVKS